VTVIAAGVDPVTRQVLIAADDASVEDDTLWPDAGKLRRKPVKTPGSSPVEVLVGTAGRKLLQHAFLTAEWPTLPRRDGDLLDWSETVAAVHRKAARDLGLVTAAEEDGDYNGAAVVAVRGRLFVVCDGAACPVRDYTAIGSGGEVARGALHALWPFVTEASMPFEVALMSACSAAEHHVASVTGPIHVERLG
jgi:hypothetical protein